MNWYDPGEVVFSTGDFVLSLEGSLLMDPAVTMDARLDFTGSTDAGISTRGSVSGLLQFSISKTLPAMVSLDDDWVNAAGGIVLKTGHLDLSGRVISIESFVSNVNEYRNLTMQNAVVSVSARWEYWGFGRSLSASGSRLSTGIFYVANGPNLEYNDVDITSTAASRIESTSFARLRFINTSPGSLAGIRFFNIIRRLEFMGRGSIQNYNQIDSLVFAGSRYYTMDGPNYVFRYLKNKSVPCGAATELHGPGGLTVYDTTTVELDNVYMRNVSGGIGNAVRGIDGGGNYGWVFTSPTGSDRYWVGGSGDWNDNNHWSNSSGGAGGACIPNARDNVFFDGLSGFTTGNRSITLATGNAFFRNMDWTGVTGAPVWSRTGSWAPEAWGDSLVLHPSATFNIPGLRFRDSTTTFLRNSVSGNFDMILDKTSGSLTLLDDYHNPATDILLVTGQLNASGRSISVSSIDNNSSADSMGVDIRNSNLVMAARWRYTGDSSRHSLAATGSTITSPQFISQGFHYHNVINNGAVYENAFVSNTRFDSLVFNNPSSQLVSGMGGSYNQVNYLEFKGNATIASAYTTISSLVFTPGKSYRFSPGSAITITDRWYASGSPCNLTVISQANPGVITSVTMPNQAPELDYVDVVNMIVGGAGLFQAGPHSIDRGGNTGWEFAAPDPAAPIIGLGPDRQVPADSFPYTIRTDGFYASPVATYNWGDASIADSLLIAAAGTYSLVVTLPDACAVSDAVTITEGLPLPVTLRRFTASNDDCSAVLAWQVSDAVAFSHFVVERSEDGQRYNERVRLNYAEPQDQYHYTDPELPDGKWYYRLRLVDMDGSSRYSHVVTVNAACDAGLIRLFPNITSDRVSLVLPARYQDAQVLVRAINGALVPVELTRAGPVRTIWMGGLQPGLYLVQVFSGSQANGSQPDGSSFSNTQGARGLLKTFRVIRQ